MQALLDDIRKQYDLSSTVEEKAVLFECIRTLENALAKDCLMVAVGDSQLIECYGVVEENSNFEVVCEDEEEDVCWADGVDDLTTWTEIAVYLQTKFDSPIIEISAV